MSTRPPGLVGPLQKEIDRLKGLLECLQTKIERAVDLKRISERVYRDNVEYIKAIADQLQADMNDIGLIDDSFAEE